MYDYQSIKNYEHSYLRNNIWIEQEKYCLEQYQKSWYLGECLYLKDRYFHFIFVPDQDVPYLFLTNIFENSLKFSPEICNPNISVPSSNVNSFQTILYHLVFLTLQNQPVHHVDIYLC